MTPRQACTAFLQQLNPPPTAVAQFERYHRWLVDENSRINLISRKTTPDEIWSLHLLDSILGAPHIDCTEKRVLDFGTGGGLPGIPLKIVYPTCHMTFMDSRAKKINSVHSAVDTLGLERCGYQTCRVEESPKSLYGRFDVIVCRSVRIEPRFAASLMQLLSAQGTLYLFKSHLLEDAEQFARKEIIDVSHPAVGLRRIVAVPFQQLR
jgi:16S rRNA (guanine527-N7)-methyltransferase